jgi:hypothetical protein
LPHLAAALFPFAKAIGSTDLVNELMSLNPNLSVPAPKPAVATSSTSTPTPKPPQQVPPPKIDQKSQKVNQKELHNSAPAKGPQKVDRAAKFGGAKKTAAPPPPPNTPKEPAKATSAPKKQAKPPKKGASPQKGTPGAPPPVIDGSATASSSSDVGFSFTSQTFDRPNFGKKAASVVAKTGTRFSLFYFFLVLYQFPYLKLIIPKNRCSKSRW